VGREEEGLWVVMVLGWWQSTVGGGNIKMARIWGLSLSLPSLVPFPCSRPRPTEVSRDY
jgi:hypothetical protein